jgi:hypothetical protein
VLRQPLLELDDFQWIGGSRKDLSQKRIRVKRNGCDKRIQLVIGNFGRLLFILRDGWPCKQRCGLAGRKQSYAYH